MSPFIRSAPRRLLALLACTLGILAALLVLATLVLLAVNGYPAGLLAAAVGAAVPVALWGAWRLMLRTRIRFWSLEGDRELTAMAEVRVWRVTAPPPPLPADRTIVV